MLETVLESIETLPDIPFGEFYNNYIMGVQDENIKYEMSYLMRYNNLNIKSMQCLINNVYRSLEW